MKSSGIVLFAVLLVLVTALRLWGLDRDPPSYDVLPDAAPWTDEGTIGLPAYLAAHGAASIPAMLADGGRPLHRLILLAAFHAPGTPRVDGRVASVLLGVLGLLALAALGHQIWPGAGSFLALLLGGTGFFFIIYDRLLLSEGPAIALLSLLTLAALRARSRWDGLAVGISLAGIAIGFKPHALALLPALAVLYGLRRRDLLAPLLAGLAVTYLGWRFVFVPAAAPSYLPYLQTRMAGEELGLVGLRQALQQILMAGAPARYLAYQVPLLLLAGFEVLACCLAPRRWLREAGNATLVALIWFLAAMAGASVFRYLPPRYFHLASPALVLLAVAGARRFWQAARSPAQTRPPAGRSWPALLLRPQREATARSRKFPGSLSSNLSTRGRLAQLAVIVTIEVFLLYQIVEPVRLSGKAYAWIPLTGLPLLLAFGFAALQAPRWSRAGRAGLLAVFLATQVLTQGGLYVAGVARSQPNLERAAAALATLPPNAVLTGRLAGTVALIEPLHGVPELENINLSLLDNLASGNAPVWVLILQHDEYRVDRAAWPFMQLTESFPVQYGSGSQALNVYRFRTDLVAAQQGTPGQPAACIDITTC